MLVVSDSPRGEIFEPLNLKFRQTFWANDKQDNIEGSDTEDQVTDEIFQERFMKLEDGDSTKIARQQEMVSTSITEAHVNFSKSSKPMEEALKSSPEEIIQDYLSKSEIPENSKEPDTKDYVKEDSPKSEKLEMENFETKADEVPNQEKSSIVEQKHF
ncbi:hypothetical protein LAZ67_7003359 [Cordylochernes scorpioides]|uniref:Uncharacterized protein n=1 Tax=Cordylochernes scorpioides TaxID=51811 RepID=A0ABY6KQF2_9ARAC|nr:hypothetical protein LAZ67_7003359 [Cordylochernes scorpioides]